MLWVTTTVSSTPCCKRRADPPHRAWSPAWLRPLARLAGALLLAGVLAGPGLHGEAADLPLPRGPVSAARAVRGLLPAVPPPLSVSFPSGDALRPRLPPDLF